MHGHVLGSRAANHWAISQIPLEAISEKSLGLIMLIYIVVKLPPPARELPGGVLWPVQYWRSGC